MGFCDRYRWTVVGHYKDPFRLAHAPHRANRVLQHRLRQAETLFGPQKTRQPLLCISQILDGEQKRAHGLLSTLLRCTVQPGPLLVRLTVAKARNWMPPTE